MPADKGPEEQFEKLRPLYKDFSRDICELIGEHCGKELIHTTQSRAKSIDGFRRKCKKTDEHGTPRYPSPLKDITDLAGVRVIVFVRDSVDLICKKIDEIFEVIEEEDVGERVYSRGKFGYQSKHLLITLGEDRSKLVENARFKGLICEVQVRTLLQHAWAEMEHDIQYKSEQEIPLDLKKRFSALAGLLEIADREFQSIQRDSDNLRQAVKAELINDLTQQGLTERKGNKSSAAKAASAQSALTRELVNQGKYEEAIKIYTSKITSSPTAYTLYIGRAKARFLAGDVKGALEDLDRADELKEDNASIRLRSIIQHGDSRSIIFDTLRDQKFAERLADAANALNSGDGNRAFEAYTDLEASGYNKAYSLLGKAMCCILERDSNGARNYLAGLGIRPTTPMAVNICALKCVLDILEKRDTGRSEKELADILRNVPAYAFWLTPLKPFYAGLELRKFPELEKIRSILVQIGASSKPEQ